MIYANHGTIAVIVSTAYMTIKKLIDGCPTPSSPEMMIIIDHDIDIYME